MASYTQAALVAQAAAATTSTPAPAPVQEKIPPSMAKFIDVEAEIPVTSVQLDGLVVSKIVKHSLEASGNASGLLLGLDLDGKLEVSNSFALPSSSTEEETSVKSAGRYETTMLRVLKEANYDDNVVGFYQSTTLGTFMRQSWINTQIARHETLRQGGIALVHDASQSSRGTASLRAFRLTKSFLAANKAGKFNSQSLLEHQITFSTILEELPVTIRTSPLLNAFLTSLSTPSSSSSPSIPPSFTTLSPPEPSQNTKSLETLLETLETHRTEENNIAFHTRQIAREKARMDSYVAKRKDENAMRVAQGLAPLPEEDVSRLFKIPTEPSRLEATLLLGQVDKLAKGLEEASAKAMVGMYAALA